ncbi:MAG TPA: acyltransferase [Thermoanaerobaculia bacterium]|nr:acyltransferase [Thermoanaerobaculia bacterium]
MSAAAPRKVHFGGLNTLRFAAALFVVIGHIPLNQSSVGLPAPSYGALFFRGAPAVSFFFTLSGFLITYLLLEERDRAGRIDVRRFYLRRVLRIWPLYFLIVAFGLAFYNALLPALGIHYEVRYSIPLAVLLYTFFLPNLMNSLYTVGGILNPLWSIGIEEQFYLVWAPAFRRATRRLPWLCFGVFAVFFTVFCLNHYAVFGNGTAIKFVGQLKFHFMAAGGFCAWWLHEDAASLLAKPPFASRIWQFALLVLLADYYLTAFIPWGWLLEELVQVVLYAWLIVDVGANPRAVFKLENRVFDYLGVISYGIYMMHMIAVYSTSALFRRTSWWHGHAVLYCIAYYGCALGLTLLLAHLSYRYFETPFLRLKDRRYSPLAPAPGKA